MSDIDTTINPIGIARIIESAARVAKHEDKVGRERLYNVAAAVIRECELPEAEKEEAVRELEEALRI